MDIDSILSSPRSSASQAAHEAVSEYSNQSKLAVLEERTRPVKWKDIREQSLLGKGAFSEVYRVEVDTAEFEDKKCAIKLLSPKITNSTDNFDLAAIDLAMEADLLSRLNHENIINLHGIYGGELESSYVKSRGNFLIIDVLEDTLAKRLERSRIKERRKFGNSVSNSKLIERIENVALGVAKGMEYLHNNGVIFRDLKPDNVGFDREGRPVIFDFGFAREMHLVQKGEIAGSLRYMSPEMAFGQDPSLPSDVYSFGVLLFEICTQQKPFRQFKSRSDFTENVLLGDYRPSLSPIQSKSIRDVISKSWDPDQTVRPDMSSTVKVLRVESALAGYRIQSESVRPIRTRSVSYIGNPNLKRRNTLANCKWDSIGKSSAKNSTFFKRQSCRIEGTSLVSNSDHAGNYVSDVSLADTSSSSILNRRHSGSVSMKRLSWSRSSFTSIGSLSTMDSNDSKAISEYTLGRLRKPFKRPSFINFVIPKPEVQANS